MMIDAPLPAGIRCGTDTATVFITPMRSTSTGVLEVHRLGVPHGQRQNPGIGHHRCQLAELGNALAEGLIELLAVAHVGLDCHAAPARFLDDPLGLHEIVPAGHRIRVGLDVLADVNGDDIRALSGLQRRVSSPLTAAGPRDE